MCFYIAEGMKNRGGLQGSQVIAKDCSEIGGGATRRGGVFQMGGATQRGGVTQIGGAT